MKILIKPLSTNKLFKGRRFRTPDYDVYEREAHLLLRKWKPVLHDKMTFHIHVGLSSKNADLDNCLKAFIDILQKKYLFNDSHIYRIEAQKEIVKKGSEYIDVEILPFLG